MNRSPRPLRTVLFDLDGTLIDTAPDLVFALNRVRAEEGLATMALDEIRPVVSLGGRAMVKRAFGLAPGDTGFEHTHARFLELYREHLTDRSRLFPGMEQVLGEIEERGLNWGIVTNKASWLTQPLVEKLGLAGRAACVVCGDTRPNRKPHPEPVRYACARTGSAPGECLFVGDSWNDVSSGREAGVRTVVVLFGYIPEDEDPRRWGADAVVQEPAGLLAHFADVVPDHPRPAPRRRTRK